MTARQGLLKAITRAGSRTKLAKLAGVTRQALTSWKTGIPPKRVMRISEKLGITPQELRPDVFGPTKRSK